MSYRYFGYRRNRRRLRWPLMLVVCAIVVAVLYAARSYANDCRGHVYLTLDTGNMRHAREIAETLRRHDVKATFFLANEKTVRGDHALDPAWSDYWRALAGEGHAFGTHTWRHGRFLADGTDGRIRYRPQFGQSAGTPLWLSAGDLCTELHSVGAAFRAATGRELDAVWRAPGGHVTAGTLRAAQACGFAHVAWADAGFLGDELPSERFPNDALLKRALRDVASGDVLMAHLGIWSRKDPFAPMIDPLIAGLRARGFCFRTLREHPQYRPRDVAARLAVTRQPGSE
jgi:peptidoglycan/xylan/chitin deacetylase (PgdA/CDA1 family)